MSLYHVVSDQITATSSERLIFSFLCFNFLSFIPVHMPDVVVRSPKRKVDEVSIGWPGPGGHIGVITIVLLNRPYYLTV